MISVIILTENKNYSILEVPANGKLIIRERHLVVGIIQNGVKMISYGVKNPLSAFETFIQNDCNSVEMIQDHFLMPEGRLLDFTAIELLQAQTTLNPVNSGSVEPYVGTEFIVNGLPLNYNIIFGGLQLSTLADATEFLKNGWNGSTSLQYKQPDAICNGIINLENGLQKLSTHFYTNLSKFQFKGSPVTYIKDLNIGITEINQGYEFANALELAYIEMPFVKHIDLTSPFYSSGQKIKEIILPKLQTLGAVDTATILYYLGSMGTKLSVPRILETINGGIPEADLTHFLDVKSGIINYLD